MPSPWEIGREMFLSEREVEALLTHVRGAVEAAEPGAEPAAKLDRIIIELLLFSGLRNSELCRLAVRDAAPRGGEPVLVIRQGASIDRLVYVGSAVQAMIADFCATARGGLLPEEVDPLDDGQPLVFHERRRPYERTGLYRRVVRILTAAGLGERASVQLLRHTYGYLAYLRTGGNLLFTQRQLGHAHPMVTSIYAQFVPESYAALADLVSGPNASPAPVENRERSPKRERLRRT